MTITFSARVFTPYDREVRDQLVSYCMNKGLNIGFTNTNNIDDFKISGNEDSLKELLDYLRERIQKNEVA